MRILVTARPAYGHVYPLMPLALAARDAGHDVAFATTGAFLGRLAGRGFMTFDVGLTIDDALAIALTRAPGAAGEVALRERPDPEVGVRAFFDVLAPATAADLPAVFATFRPDLVVYEQYDVGAGIAAHASDIPAVCHAVSPRAVTRIGETLAADAVARLWSDAGRAGTNFDMFTGDEYLDIVPDIVQTPSFRHNPDRRLIRPVGYSEPGSTVPAWLDRAERPVVYLTLGTFSATDAALAVAISGLSRLDVDVIVALGSANGEALGHAPRVHVERFVDQANLVPRVDLVVHHGGSGTMLAALASGTPQLVLPQGADQFLNAEALAAADLAAFIEPAELTADAVAELAEDALRTERPLAQRAREQIGDMPAPDVVVERLAARYRR